MDSEDISEMGSTASRKAKYPAEIKIAGKNFPSRMRYAGKSSLLAYKKNYNVDFTGRGYRGFREIRLSGQSRDQTGVKTLFGFEVYKRIGLPTPFVEPAALYLNNEYLGLAVLVEAVDDDFFASRSLSFHSLYKAIFGNADFSKASLTQLPASFEPKAGPADYNDLARLITLLQEPATEETAAKLREILNIDGLMRYLIASLYINHWDGYRNNFYIYRKKTTEQFNFVPWDLDRIFEEEKTEAVTQETVFGGNELARYVLSYPSFRQSYRQLFQDFLKEFPLSAAEQSIRQWASKVKEAYAHDRVLTSSGKSAEEQAEALINDLKAWHGKVAEEIAINP